MTRLNDYVISKPYKVHNIFLQKYWLEKGFDLNVTYCPNCSDECDDCSIRKEIEKCQTYEYCEFEGLINFINENDVRNYTYFLEL